MLNVGIFGSDGRMGQEISKAAKESSMNSSSLSLDDGRGSLNVVIDFSSPAGTLAVAQWCEKNRIPLVSGTTGFGAEHFAALKNLSRVVAVLWSPNMSLGLNTMASTVEHYIKIVKPTEVMIEETHHVHKKDSPSGTAKFLLDVVKKVAPKETKVKEPISHREGDVFGIHKVICQSGSERVVFEHTAQDRGLFAQGALAASRWLIKQPQGFYSMADFLGGRS